MKPLPQPNHEYGYTYTLLQDTFGDSFQDFQTWMRGQTVTGTPSGETVYYHCDVERWYKAAQRGNKDPIVLD